MMTTMKVVAVGFWSWWVVANLSRVVVEMVGCRECFADGGGGGRLSQIFRGSCGSGGLSQIFRRITAVP